MTGFVKECKKILYRILHILLNSKSSIKLISVKVKKILIPVDVGVGNFVFFLPTLHTLRNYFKYAEIYFLCGTTKGIPEILEGSRLASKIVIFNPRTANLIQKIKFVLKIRGEHFDLFIGNFQHRNNNFLSFLLALGNIPLRVGHTSSRNWQNHIDYVYNYKVPFDVFEHEIYSNFRLVKCIGINIEPPLPHIHVKEDKLNKAKDLFRKEGILENGEAIIVGIHPGSDPNFKEKRWEEKKYAAVITHLIKVKKIKVIILGSEADKDSITKLKLYLKNMLTETELKKYIFDFSCSYNLEETSAFISLCDVFISNDSGLSKISLALGVPTVTIWGPSNIYKSGAWDSKKGIDLRLNLPCSPCYTVGDFQKAKNCPNKVCLRYINSKMVVSAVKKLIELNNNVPRN